MELQTKDYKHFKLEIISNISSISSVIDGKEFDGAFLANKSLPGDIVVWNNKCEIIKRNKHILVGTLELNSKTKYGITSKGYPLYLFIPFNRAYPSFIVGSSHKDCSKNYVGIINFDSWNDTLPRGSLVRLLGPCDNNLVQEEALLINYHPYKISKNIEVELETTSFNTRFKCPELTFNIDPEGCMDIDDVISLRESELWITIADVAERVSEGSEVDIYAALQGQTVYKNGQAIQPMLPYELSENRCSLQPGVLRPGVTLIIKYTSDRPYRITELGWTLTSVLNKTSYNYETFKKNASKNGINLNVLQDLAEEILGESTDDPHKWIEAFMLKYNIEAAKILCKEQQGILRKHLGKDEAKWEQYTQWDKELSGLASHAASYCSIDDPSPKHVGIGSIYCHATSPIRRYADLVNQRVLKNCFGDYILRSPTIEDSTYSIPILNMYGSKICPPPIEWLNKRQKDCKRYERDLFFIENIGKGSLNGIILSEKKVWIQSWKRIVTWKNNLVPGTKVTLDYFVNPNIRHWKERIVFHLASKDVDRDCQE